MDGRPVNSGAGGRFPIRHGVGGLTIRFIHSFRWWHAVKTKSTSRPMPPLLYEDDDDDANNDDEDLGSSGYRTLAIGDQIRVIISRNIVIAWVTGFCPEDRSVAVSYLWKTSKTRFFEASSNGSTKTNSASKLRTSTTTTRPVLTRPPPLALVLTALPHRLPSAVVRTQLAERQACHWSLLELGECWTLKLGRQQPRQLRQRFRRRWRSAIALTKRNSYSSPWQ